MPSSHNLPGVNSFGEADHGTLGYLASLLDGIRQQHGHQWIVDNARSPWVDDTHLDENLRVFRNAVRNHGADTIIGLAELSPKVDRSEDLAALSENNHLQPTIDPTDLTVDQSETPSSSSSPPTGQNKKRSAKNVLRFCLEIGCGWIGSYLAKHLRDEHNFEAARAKNRHDNAPSQCPVCDAIFPTPYETWDHYKDCDNGPESDPQSTTMTTDIAASIGLHNMAQKGTVQHSSGQEPLRFALPPSSHNNRPAPEYDDGVVTSHLYNGYN